jgi:hypothetical protein
VNLKVAAIVMVILLLGSGVVVAGSTFSGNLVDFIATLNPANLTAQNVNENNGEGVTALPIGPRKRPGSAMNGHSPVKKGRRRGPRNMPGNTMIGHSPAKKDRHPGLTLKPGSGMKKTRADRHRGLRNMPENIMNGHNRGSRDRHPGLTESQKLKVTADSRKFTFDRLILSCCC